MKTFYGGPDGWHDIQLPDGTVIWTSPSGRTYTTHPGSKLFFQTWDTTTANLPTTVQRAQPGSPRSENAETKTNPRRRIRRPNQSRTGTPHRTHTVLTGGGLRAPPPEVATIAE